MKKQQLSNSYFFYYKNYNYPIDSILNLANKCPYTNGTVVYAARNLYNALTNRINSFEEECSGGEARGIKKGFIKLHQPKTIASNTVLASVSGIKVFPNPAKSIVNVVCNNMKEVSIFDMLGKVITTHKCNNDNIVSITLNNINAGIYVVKVMNTKGEIRTSKLIIE